MDQLTMLALCKPENTFWFYVRPRLTCDECYIVIPPCAKVYQTHQPDEPQNKTESKDICQRCVENDISLIQKYSLVVSNTEEAVRNRINYTQRLEENIE